MYIPLITIIIGITQNKKLGLTVQLHESVNYQAIL